MLWLDDYERRARLAPGLLALLPVVLLLAVEGWRQLTVVSSLVSLLSLAGGPLLLADVVRRLGRNAERQLWAAWGGPPTTRWLRLCERSDNVIRRNRWRQAVASVSGQPLLSLRGERSDPGKADQAIETAIGDIRRRTRDRAQFGLLFSENCAYGFNRNLYGLRWIGRAVALMCALALGANIVRLETMDMRGITPPNVIGLMILTALIGLWFLPTRTRVRDAAERYAVELMEAAVSLEQDGSPPRATSTNGGVS